MTQVVNAQAVSLATVVGLIIEQPNFTTNIVTALVNYLLALPTSATGLPVGALYWDGGVLAQVQT